MAPWAMPIIPIQHPEGFPIMSTFSQRLSVGESHEDRVRRELEDRGWEVTPWGQSILPELTRRVLRNAAPRFRHFPDLIAARPGELVVVDAKDRMHSTHTNRYAVAQECVSFGLQAAGAFGWHLCYVFGNLGILTPSEVHTYGTRTRGTGGGAYYLVPERLGRHFDDVFGHPAEGSAAALQACLLAEHPVTGLTPPAAYGEPRHRLGNRSRAAACGTCRAGSHFRRRGRPRFLGTCARGRG